MAENLNTLLSTSTVSSQGLTRFLALQSWLTTVVFPWMQMWGIRELQSYVLGENSSSSILHLNAVLMAKI